MSNTTKKSPPPSTGGKIDLTPGKLARPMDRSNMGNDAATLRALTGMLNNPAITGAEAPPPEEKYSAPAGGTGATIVADSAPTEAVLDVVRDVMQGGGTSEGRAKMTPSPGAPAPYDEAALAASPPIALTPPKPRSTVLLTGRDTRRVLANLASIGAQEFRVYGPIADLATYLFPAFVPTLHGAPTLLENLRAWGNGDVNEDHPLDAERIIFVKMIRSIAGVIPVKIDWAKFGNPGFWVDACLAVVRDHQDKHPNVPVFVTGVLDKYEFDYFRAQQFSHWHVMSQRAPGGNDFNSMLDNDVTRQVSQQRTGPKLRCIWAENTPPVSPRLWSLTEFIASFKQ